MATQNLDLRSTGQPELHLLLPKETFEQPLWKSLFQNIDEFLFPKKLPPLKLTSKPEPVREIWGFYNYTSRSATASTILHIFMISGIIAISLVGRRVVRTLAG
jgi:hypothetical protein